MSLFNTPHGNDPRFFEAWVLAVDPDRSVCKIRSVFGQNFDGVVWICPGYETPEFKDKVNVTTITGNPIIYGIMPTVGDASDFAIHIDQNKLEADTGNYSTLSRGVINDPEKPGDLLSGDVIRSNKFGGLFGLLKTGTFVAKASRLAQVCLFRLDDLVRIVGRNYEVFTDLFMDVTANIRGRAYRFVGYADTVAAARTDSYKYQEIYGDTAIGLVLQGNNYGYTSSTFNTLSLANPANGIIKKCTVNNGVGGTLFKQDILLTGQVTTRVQNAANSAFTIIDQTNSTIVLGYNGVNTFTISPTQIFASYNSGTQTMLLDSTQATLTYASGAQKVVLNATNATVSFGTSTIGASSTQCKLQFSTHTIIIDSTGIHLDYNSGTHGINITAAGVVNY